MAYVVRTNHINPIGNELKGENNVNFVKLKLRWVNAMEFINVIDNIMVIY